MEKTNSNKSNGRIVGLQIGGNVDPSDKVGMHIKIPSKPGVGVEVDINNVDRIVKEILDGIPKEHPKAEDIKKIVEEILQEKDNQAKVQKASMLISMGAGIIQIAEKIGELSVQLGL